MKKVTILCAAILLFFVACVTNNEESQPSVNESILNQTEETHAPKMEMHYNQTTVEAFQDTINSIQVSTDMKVCDCVDRLFNLYKIMDYYFPDPASVEKNLFSEDMQSFANNKFKKLNKICNAMDSTGLSNCDNYNNLMTYNKVKEQKRAAYQKKKEADYLIK